MSHHRPSIALAVALALGGCTDLDARTEYLTGPEAFTWESDIRFLVVGEDEMWGQAMAIDDELSVFVKGFPPGTVVSAGSGSATVDDEGDASFDTLITSLLGSVPTTRLGTTHEVPIEGAHMTIAPPGRDAFDVPLTSLHFYLSPEFLTDRARDEQPLVFGDEPEDAPLRSVVWFQGIDHHVVGRRAPTLADLDGVALIEQRATGETRTCTGYTTTDGQPAPDLRLTLMETVVSVHARRTGREVATHRFAPVDECPTFASGQRGQQIERESDVPTAAITAWLESQLAE